MYAILCTYKVYFVYDEFFFVAEIFLKKIFCEKTTEDKICNLYTKMTKKTL